MDNPENQPVGGATRRPLLRPLNHLHNLPVEYRWEFTRRHPYYLQSWKLAHDFRGGLLADPVQHAHGRAAMLILQCIGVTDDPWPPGTGPEALGVGQLAKAWQGGAIAPITFRGLAGVLIRDLPSETRRLIGQALLDSTTGGEDEIRRRYAAFEALMHHRDPALDNMPNRPIVGINLYAPARAIQEAVEQMVRDLKQQEGIPERRRRDDMLEQYLKVWDLREGWIGDQYDVARELPFQQIATQLGLPVRTVANGYYAAFRWISGHDYSFENWVRIFIVIKLLTVYGGRSLRRRRVISPSRSPESTVPVPESRLQSKGQSGGSLIGNEAVASDEIGDTEFLMDIRELIRQSRPTQAIVKELQLDAEWGPKLVNYLRQHAVDRPN